MKKIGFVYYAIIKKELSFQLGAVIMSNGEVIKSIEYKGDIKSIFVKFVNDLKKTEIEKHMNLKGVNFEYKSKFLIREYTDLKKLDSECRKLYYDTFITQLIQNPTSHPDVLIFIKDLISQLYLDSENERKIAIGIRTKKRKQFRYKSINHTKIENNSATSYCS